MSTISTWLAEASAKLQKAGIGSAQLDAELLLCYLLRQNRAWLKAHADYQLTEPEKAAANVALARRANREPLVHITGNREFYGVDFEITPDVLTPRVETEQMVDFAIKYAPKNSRLIDIGTGSGAIAIAIKKHRPDLDVTATDLSERELSVSRRNASKQNLEIRHLASDLWAALSDETFDTIVTNLPYLTTGADLMPEVRREPAVALFGGPDGLHLYRRFLKDVPAHLSPAGFLFTESDPWQHEALVSEASKYGLSVIEEGYFILGFQLPA